MSKVRWLVSLLAVLVPAAGLAGLGAAETDPGRLGTGAIPRFEEIRLILDPARPGYTGTVRVDLAVSRTLPEIRFHAEGLTLTTVVLEGPDGRLDAHHRDAGNSIIAVGTGTPLAPGDYRLEVAFSGRLAEDGVGLYRMEKDGEAYAFTQFEAIWARRAFPCWDEPDFKLPYQITVQVPQQDLAVSNTPVEREEVAGGIRTVTFRRTPPLPSYLLALAAGPLETVPIPGMSVPGRVVTVKGQAGLAGEAVRVTPGILSALERWFGRKYPYEKLDLIAVPEMGFYGAMENAGAVTFSDAILLADPKSITDRQRQGMIETIAHELAHMWFGDLVTMRWWDDLWLNESFATWMGEKITDELYPGFRVRVSEVRSAQGAMAMDTLLSTGAIRKPITTADAVFSSDTILAYSKGGAVLEMVESWIGREAFRKGVNDYLSTHEWGTASGADLWAALGKASGQDVAGLLSSFLDKPGVPVVGVETLPEGGMRLTQRRFLNYGVKEPKPSAWRIPVSLRWADSEGPREEKVILSDSAKATNLPTHGPVKWIHPNAGEQGYYRWSLPGPLLEKLVEEAPRQLSPRERVALVGNLGALLDAGSLGADTWLRLTERLSGDPEPEVISAVMDSLGKVKEAFVQPGMEPAFARYVRATLGPSLDRFGMSRAAKEPETVTTMRPELLLWLGREGQDPKVGEAALSLVRKYLESPQSVDPSLIGTALRIAARQGDQKLFDTYRRRFEAATVPEDRIRFLSALGAFRNPKIFDQALAYALSGPLQVQELFSIPMAGADTEGGRERVFRWVTENYAALSGRISPELLPFLVQVGGGCSMDRAEAARKFFLDPSRRVPGTDQEMAKVMESVEQCVSLRGREGAAVARFLGKSRPAAP